MSPGDFDPTADQPEDSATIGDTRLRGEPGPRGYDATASAQINRALVQLVLTTTRQLSRTPGDASSGPVARTLANATKVAANAALGKLEAAGLQGELVQAQIANLYADARLKNAQAEEIEARVASEREQAAIVRLERIIKAFMSRGVPIDAAMLEDGVEAALLGDGLTDTSENQALADRSSTGSE